MHWHLERLADYSLLFLRFMIGLIFADSGYNHVKAPKARGESIGLPPGAALVLGIAELLGGLAVIVGIWPQLASIGLILVMLGAIQKKALVWKTGFWGKDGLGWYYELTLVSMLVVVLVTDGGRFVLIH